MEDHVPLPHSAQLLDPACEDQEPGLQELQDVADWPENVPTPQVKHCETVDAPKVGE